MSRALTVFSRSEERQKLPPTQVEKIMEAQGCSEPVAKNLLKYAKLGIGPLAGIGGSSEDPVPQQPVRRENIPPRVDRKTAALLAEQKLRERQEQEEAAEAFLRPAKKQQTAGLQRLGPVMARENEVDPIRPPVSRSSRDDEEDPNQGAFETGFNGRPKTKKPMQIAGISKLGPVLARDDDPLDQASGSKGPDDEDDDEDDEKAAQWRTVVDSRKRQQDDRNKGNKKSRRRKGRDHDESPERSRSRSAQREPSPPSGPAGSGLMSESQIKAMMKKNRQSEAKRGTVRANLRIQKEIQEWESRKANNPEFWKAPQFALCYSAETGKKARGAG